MKALKIEIENPDDIKDLLFASAIYDNEKVSMWFDNFKEYFKIKKDFKEKLLEIAENM